MQIHLISIGNRMPGWVKAGYEDYAKRMPRECRLVLKEIPPNQRGKRSAVAKILVEEGERLISAIPDSSHVIALDKAGNAWSTPELAEMLARWRELGKPVALLVGGPEGLSDAVKNLAVDCWSLSPLTFPHPLVRVVVAEQLYRAWSILQNHPYHRE